MKVDVEGAEVRLLHGASGMLRNQAVGMILMEICPPNLIEMGNSVEDLFNYMKSFDYFPYQILPTGEIGKKLEVDDLIMIKLANIVMTYTK